MRRHRICTLLLFSMCSMMLGGGSIVSAKKHHKTARKKVANLLVKPPVVDCSTGKGNSQLPRKMIFSFDDGPSKATDELLSLLQEYGIHAVFFVNGWRLQPKNPNYAQNVERLKSAAQAGHLIGNHTINHSLKLCKTTDAKILDEIEGNATIIKQIIGREPDLFRAPYGHQCEPIKRIQNKLYLIHIGWDIDTNDWNLTEEDMYQRLVAHAKAIHPGSVVVVLAHDTHESTVKAFRRFLQWMKGENSMCDSKNLSQLEVASPYLLIKRATAPIPGAKVIKTGLEIPALRALWRLASGSNELGPVTP